MKVLFIGGTGIISSACAALAIERGIELTLVVRGISHETRPYPPGARVLVVDARDPAAMANALGNETFDSVVDFVAFTPDQIEIDLEIFRGRTRQFTFISSASAYDKPVKFLPISESTPLRNPHWKYSRDKIACEERLVRAYREEDFPITIVRPSHTYDRTLLPFDPHGAGGTIFSRILAGKPVVVHGDGTSLWVLTHNTDFAVGFVGLLGHPRAIGEAFHITSDEALPWNEVFQSIARALGRTASFVHVPSDVIARHHPEWGAGLLGDKAHSVLFDNTKVKRLVPDFAPKIPFAKGAREIVEYHLANPERLRIDERVDGLMEKLAAAATSW